MTDPSKKFLVAHAPASGGGPEVLILVLPINAFITGPDGTPHPSICLEPAEARLLAYQLLLNAQEVELGIPMATELTFPDTAGGSGDEQQKN